MELKNEYERVFVVNTKMFRRKRVTFQEQSSSFLQFFLRTVSQTVSRTFLKRSSQAVSNPRMTNHRRIIFQVGTERPLTVHRIRLDQTHRHKDVFFFIQMVHQMGMQCQQRSKKLSNQWVHSGSARVRVGVWRRLVL